LQGRADNPVIAELTAAGAALTDPIDAGFVREFQESTFARPIPEAFLELVIEESRKVPVRVFRDALAGLVEDDVSAELARIGAPTLLVWGDQDAYAVLGGLAGVEGCKVVPSWCPAGSRPAALELATVGARAGVSTGR
jgi:pimeloyl-ACP methyl ester carboxylesterase